MWRWTALAFLLACGWASLTPVNDGAVSLKLPRAPQGNEVLVARVAVGELKAGDVIAVRTASGRVAGTIVSRGERHTIPMPDDAVTDGRLALRFEVRQRGAAPRKATAAEVVGVKAEFVAATRLQPWVN